MKEVIHLVSAETYDKKIGGLLEVFCGTSTNDYFYIGAGYSGTWNLARIKTSLQTPGQELCSVCKAASEVTLIELGMAEL
jgi:hypothetical protein